MRILEQYMECMKKGDNIGLADLFNEKEFFMIPHS